MSKTWGATASNVVTWLLDLAKEGEIDDLSGTGPDKSETIIYKVYPEQRDKLRALAAKWQVTQGQAMSWIIAQVIANDIKPAYSDDG